MRPAIALVGRYPVHVGHLKYGERLEWFRKFGLNSIYGMPSYLNTLTSLCEEMGYDPRKDFPDFRSYVLAGESYPIEWAERMQDFWGIKLHETYGSTQTGGTCTAGTCRHGAIPGSQRGRMHLFEWSVFYEVLDPATGEPVGPGEEGELYVTTLDREASATLRFASGDRVRWLPWNECSCGLPFDSIEAGTVGRLDDMLKIKGMNVWPSAVDEIMFSHAEIVDYRATVTVTDRGRTAVVVAIAFSDNLIPAGEARQAFMATLSDELRQRIGITFDLCEATRAEMKEFEFKARRWSDERHKRMESGR
jgi:phenylacetate-CoA ligase